MKIPRTFCVTLRETPARSRGFQEMAIVTGLDFEYFYGFLGNKLGLAPKFPNTLEVQDSEIFLSEGNLGCFLSHISLWNTLLHLPEDEFFIVEDDAVFVENFRNKFETIYSKLPADWEMAYVGWIPYGLDTHPILVDEGVSIRLPSATHAYLIKKSAIQKILSVALPIQSPIDLTLIQRALPVLRYYVFDPSLVEQRSYLNTTDPTWSSLVYDWNNDLYGCKKSLCKNLSLVDGWHMTEHQDKEFWRWSKDKFTINLPTSIDSIVLEGTTPIENSLSILIGAEKQEFPLIVGYNKLLILTKNQPQLVGELATQFIPSRQGDGNSDNRVLGLCLRKIILNMGSVKIVVNVQELAGATPMAFTFRL